VLKAKVTRHYWTGLVTCQFSLTQIEHHASFFYLTWVIMGFKLFLVSVLYMPVKNSSNKWRYQCNACFSTSYCL